MSPRYKIKARTPGARTTCANSNQSKQYQKKKTNKTPQGWEGGREINKSNAKVTNPKYQQHNPNRERNTQGGGRKKRTHARA